MGPWSYRTGVCVRKDTRDVSTEERAREDMVCRGPCPGSNQGGPRRNESVDSLIFALQAPEL